MQIKPLPSITMILLAAGESSRLGTPKQLLKYKDKKLIQHTIDLTNALGLDAVLVLGAFNELILEQVDTYDLKVVHNMDWREGLASSIRCGVEGAVKENQDTEAVILMLCDQPLLTVDIIQKIIDKYLETGLPIIHCDYGETSGPPTLFHKSLFQFLLKLQGHEGGKKVVNTFPDKVVLVDFPEGKWDIDTPEDFQHLLNM